MDTKASAKASCMYGAVTEAVPTATPKVRACRCGMCRKWGGGPVGLFDHLSEVELDHQIFIDQKPAYHAFANETSNMTAAEVFAQFGELSEE